MKIHNFPNLAANPFLRRIFEQLPYRWQLALILAAWEYQYRRRRRRWHWCSNQLSGRLPRRAGQRDELVSVVLPVYNQGSTLQSAIESVLQQTYPQIELIIVNDGSTDQTPAVLDGFGNDPTIKIIHQPNYRLPTALNRGFEAASGEFLTWTSADNLMAPDQVNQLVTYLRNHPDAALVYADFELIDETSQPVRSAAELVMRGEANSAIVRQKREPDRLNIGYECVIGPCFLYRSFLPPLIGQYNPGLEGSEDFDYWIRVHNFLRIDHLGSPQPLYEYRIHPNRMTNHLKKQVRLWRHWLMQREQQFQKRLKTPAEVVADEPSLNLLARTETDRHRLPQLEVKPLTGGQQEPTQPAAFLFKVTPANVAAIRELKRRHSLPFILWADNDADTALLSEAGPLADLMIVLTDLGGFDSTNILIAQSILDMGELIRIFVGSKIYAGTASLPQ